MTRFFTIKTDAYNGPELGPKDTVSVEIQRYDAHKRIISRAKLTATVVDVETIGTDAMSDEIEPGLFRGGSAVEEAAKLDVNADLAEMADENENIHGRKSRSPFLPPGDDPGDPDAS